MALRLQCDFYTVENGTEYNILIYDKEYVGSVVDFLTDGNGYVITWQGDGEKMKIPVLTSTCAVNMYEDSSGITDFVNDLTTAYEGQFRMVITSSGVATVWVGILLIDSIELQDKPQDTLPVFRIVASDGVKRLKTIPYKDAAGPYAGADSIVNHLIKIIGNIGTTDLMTYLPYVLRCTLNWVPSSIAAGDVADNTSFQHRALYQIDKRGNYKYQSVYKVLEMICYTFGAKFFMWQGVYYFVQHNEYENVTWTIYNYTSAGTLTTSSVTNIQNTVDSTFTGKFGRGTYTFFAPLNRARVNYVHFGYGNLATGYVWDESAQPTIPESPTTYNVPANTSFDFFAVLQATLTYSGAVPYNLRFSITLQVGTEYWNRPATPATPAYNGVETIESSASTFQWVEEIELAPAEYYAAGEIKRKRLRFPSIQFPTGGDVLFTINLDGAYDQQGNAVTGVTTLWSFTDVELVAIPFGDLENWTNTRTATAYNATTGNSESVTINTGIGERLGFGKLIINTGASTQDGTDWGIGATAAGQKIEELNAIELIRTQSVPIKRMRAQFSATEPDIFKSIVRSSDVWIPYKMKFYGNEEYIQGEWYLLNTTGTTTGNTEEDVIIDDIDDSGNDITPNNPDGQPPTNTGDNTTGGGGTNSALSALFPRTNADIASGATITQIPIETRTIAGEWKTGQTITVVDPVTGAQQEFTVTADTAISDTYISVTSVAAAFDFRDGSWIITSQEVQGSTGGSSSIYREEFAAHASATITVTVNSGNLPTNTAAIRLYFDNGQLISPNYWSVSGSDITLTFTPGGQQSIWVEFQI